MLTRKQLELLDFINKRIQRDGVPPSFDEMKEALNLRSKSGIHRLITALEERGFKLARGDRRGYVAIDETGEPYAVARWSGVKTKAVRERLGDASTLPSLAEAQERYAREMRTTMDAHRREMLEAARERKEEHARARAA